MCDKTALLAEIRACLKITGKAASYFGKQSCGNSEVVERLEAGGDVTTTTAARIRKYISETTRATNQEATPAQP
jgi:hypothetical protein